MFFAVSDYIRYSRRRGRFARCAPNSEMGAAFLGDLPASAVDLLRPADILFTSQYGSLLAWAVMYLTESEVNHVAIYIGSGNIAHATLGGLVIDRIEALYNPDVRILPVRVDETEERRQFVVARARSRIGEGYGWKAVLRKFVAIITGRDRPYFRWRFFADVVATLALMDLALWPIAHRFVFVWLALPYLALIVVNLIRWRSDPLPDDDTYASPQEMLLALKARRGRRVVDADALARQEAAGATR